MAFFWNGDQLFTKSAVLENKSAYDAYGKPWTTFLLNLRMPLEFPDPLEFGQFLASSLVGICLKWFH